MCSVLRAAFSAVCASAFGALAAMVCGVSRLWWTLTRHQVRTLFTQQVLHGPCAPRSCCSQVTKNDHVFAAAVEIGGGPWDEAWETEARMREPLKSLVKLPVDLDGAASLLPPRLRPPGI